MNFHCSHQELEANFSRAAHFVLPFYLFPVKGMSCVLKIATPLKSFSGEYWPILYMF